jgi:hypothetical protein
MPKLGRLICMILMLLAGLVALAMDWQVVNRQLAGSGSIVPGDQWSFRENAELVTHHMVGAPVASAAGLPYPPPFLLLSMPLSWCGPLAGYIGWILAGNLALILAARALRLPWPAVALGLASPANLYCMAMGQTGLFVSAFTLLSLGLAGSQPVLAGIAAGCLIIKPQFGLLLPVCYLAARNWRAFGAAAATVAALCALPALCFGAHVWRDFFVHPVASAPQLLNDAWPNKFQYTMVTVFMMCRSLGAGFGLAYAAQGIASLAAAVLAWRLWRGEGGLARIAITLCLAALATPYAYTYDLAALSMALAGYAWARGGSLAPVALFWVFTGFYVFFSTFWFLTGALFLAALAVTIQASGRFSEEKLRKRLL